MIRYTDLLFKQLHNTKGIHYVQGAIHFFMSINVLFYIKQCVTQIRSRVSWVVFYIVQLLYYMIYIVIFQISMSPVLMWLDLWGKKYISPARSHCRILTAAFKCISFNTLMTQQSVNLDSFLGAPVNRGTASHAATLQLQQWQKDSDSLCKQHVEEKQQDSLWT